MAVGAKKAFQELPNGSSRDRWLNIPYTGCDGMPGTGQAWVRSGRLSATIVVPANAGNAIEMALQAINSGVLPPERTMTVPISYPALNSLSAKQAEKSRILSV